MNHWIVAANLSGSLGSIRNPFSPSRKILVAAPSKRETMSGFPEDRASNPAIEGRRSPL